GRDLVPGPGVGPQVFQQIGAVADVGPQVMVRIDDGPLGLQHRFEVGGGFHQAIRLMAGDAGEGAAPAPTMSEASASATSTQPAMAMEDLSSLCSRLSIRATPAWPPAPSA